MDILTHAHAIDKTSNFRKKITETETYQEKTDENVTQCTKCSGKKGICHHGCAYGNGEDKEHCYMMSKKDGNCNGCGCHWTVHVNSDIVYKDRSVERTIDVEALKKQFTDGAANLSNS